MPQLIVHWFHFAELYAVMLTWIVVPLGFYASFLFLGRHYGMFVPRNITKDGPADGVH